MAIDWDVWRRDHHKMGFADQQAFYERAAKLHPNQRNFDLPACQMAFQVMRGDALDVIELGGWDGALASAIINPKIASWTNYDLVAVPQACNGGVYSLVVLEDYIWNLPPVPCDVFLATHTIEHLTLAELHDLLDWVDSRYLYIEAPLAPYGLDWTGYHGSHILEIGWVELGEILTGRGYTWLVPNLWERL